MSIKRLALLIVLTGILSACSFFGTKDNTPAPRTIYANEENSISLQNPTTKVIVRCYSSSYESSEVCAKFFEGRDYVRFRDIPYKTANYDFLKPGSYPTRRWRNGERTPRW